LLDVNMPDMDGLEVCRRIKSQESTRNVPIIFVTANNSPVEEEQAFDGGAADFIPKPFHENVVKARVRAQITLKMQSDALRSLAVEIAEARDEALHAASAKAAFLAAMSHEIRTPMSGVVGMSELLLLTTLTDEQRSYATVAHDSGQSLLRVINDILDFSKIEAGKLDLEAVAFGPASQVESVVALLRNGAEGKGVTLCSQVAENVPDVVMGDPGRVRQILLNFVGNALKFTPAGGVVRVDVIAESRVDERVGIRYTVRDTGIGIAPDVQARLFEPFAQANAGIARKFGGTGLGLSICKQLVVLMGGTIGVESVAGEGASFWFLIPFVPSDAALHIRDATPRDDGDRRTTVRARTERILLVEDDDVTVMLAKLQFKRLGFEVMTACNGLDACRAVQAADYDLIFMDCQMPKMDGFEATKQIRKLEAGTARRVPIVAMTADAHDTARDACLAAGMNDYVSKPTTLASLGTIFERWLPLTVV
jgi:signal transduction histidine kinase